MARRRKIKKFVKFKKAGWYYKGIRIGKFCPNCGEPAYLRNGVHPRYLCFNCGWEEPPIKLKVVKIDEKHYALYNEAISRKAECYTKIQKG